MAKSGIFLEIEQALKEHPDNIAIQMFTLDGEVRYTHRETHDLARRVSQSLRDRGLKKGDRVAFLSRLSPNWVIAYLGSLYAGGVILPLDFEYGEKELSSVLDQAKCNFIFTANEKLSLVKSVKAEMAEPRVVVVLDASQESDTETLSLEKIFDEKSEITEGPDISENDIATIFFTSGTTGVPKGVVISHRSFATTLRGILQYLEISSVDVALAVIPSHHVFASLANILMPLAMGGTATYLRNINSTELLNTMQKAKITVFPGVPQIFYLLHKKIFDEVKARPLAVRIIFNLLLKLSGRIRETTGINLGRKLFASVHKTFGGHMRLFISAASYFDPAIIRDFHSLGFTVQQGYALTETVGGGTFTPYYDNVIGSVGKPIPGVELKIVDHDETGVGEIVISGPSLMEGYFNNPEATAEVMRDGWFLTGDLASMDDDGNVFIRGRRKEMIVLSSGKNVYPEEVEQHYLQDPHIKEMCVMGIKGEDDYANSERLHAVIVPDFDYLKQQRIVNSKEIIREGIEANSASLPRYKRILTYEIRTEPLPRTASRKIQRFLVKSSPTNGNTGPAEAGISDYKQQEGDDLLQAAESSRKALDVIRRETKMDSDLHLDMNLELDLGFDSLQRIELLAQIEQVIGVRLGDDVASQTFTVRDLLQTIQKRISEGNHTGAESAQPVRLTWKEIIATAKSDDMAEKYIIEPSLFSRVIHFLFLKFIYLLAKILFRVKVRGLDNLNLERPFLICPNHQSYLDGPLVASVLPYKVIKYMFTLGFTPFFSGGFKDTIARVARIVPVDADTNLGRAMRISAIGLKAEQNLLIFPEGGLSCDGELQKFKKGTGILAHELQVPIVPVAVQGSFDAWSKVGDKIRLKPVSITFGKPILIQNQVIDSQDLDVEYVRITQMVRDSISNMIEVDRRA